MSNYELVVETTAGADTHPDQQEATHQRRSNILSAMEQRASANTAMAIPSHQQPTLERHTTSLRETCSKAVAGEPSPQ